MKKFVMAGSLSLSVLLGLFPSAAHAVVFYNYTDGTFCYVVACDGGGCVTVDKFLCPLEVSGGG